MRKTAFLSTFVVILTLSLTSLSAQVYTYILYNGNSMDRLDHQFLGTNSASLYTSYRITKNASERVFLDIGIESPRIHKNEPPGMVTWQNANLDMDFVSGINSGRRKVYICKKLDSGWAVQPVGSAIYLSNVDNILTYVSTNYDFKADFNQVLGNNLGINSRNVANPSNVFYVGELPACGKTAQTFKITPSETCKYETTVSVLPELGLIRENPEACPTYELVAVNGVDVCSYLGGGTVPAAIVQSEPSPEVVPESYVAVQPYVPVETVDNGEVYVRSKTVVENNNITKSDNFDETPSDVPVSYNEVEKPKPAKVECNVAAADGEHLIQSGENLYSIARRYGLNVNSLRTWNNLSTDKLYPCTTLKIVAPIVEKVEKPSMEVARTNDVPMSYNTVVKVTPKKVEKPVETKVIECEVEYTEGEHVVLQGENLYAIARKYNVTLDQLKSWNKLPNDLIKPCQKLAVVAPKATVVTAKSVDVPKEYKVVVKPKTAVKTTSKTTVTAKSVAKTPATYVKKGTGLHVVEKGETIVALAKRFEMSEAEFRKINFLDAKETVSVGQVVRTQNCACTIAVEDDHSLSLQPTPVVNDVPKTYNYVGSKTSKTTEGVTAKGSNRKYHVVQSTETLYTIAKNYGKSVDEIRKLNNIEDSEVIVPNQLLVLE